MIVPQLFTWQTDRAGWSSSTTSGLRSARFESWIGLDWTPTILTEFFRWFFSSFRQVSGQYLHQTRSNSSKSFRIDYSATIQPFDCVQSEILTVRLCNKASGFCEQRKAFVVYQCWTGLILLRVGFSTRWNIYKCEQAVVSCQVPVHKRDTK
jgi:hypothetical protein